MDMTGYLALRRIAIAGFRSEPNDSLEKHAFRMQVDFAIASAPTPMRSFPGTDGLVTDRYIRKCLESRHASAAERNCRHPKSFGGQSGRIAAQPALGNCVSRL
jgi:hypothetical protein